MVKSCPSSHARLRSKDPKCGVGNAKQNRPFGRLRSCLAKCVERASVPSATRTASYSTFLPIRISIGLRAMASAIGHLSERHGLLDGLHKASSILNVAEDRRQRYLLHENQG